MRTRTIEVTVKGGWQASVDLYGSFHPATMWEPAECPDVDITGLWYPDGVEAGTDMLEHLPALKEAIENAALEADENRSWENDD